MRARGNSLDTMRWQLVISTSLVDRFYTTVLVVVIC